MAVPVILVHGGAGARGRPDAERDDAVRRELASALRRGSELLQRGGSALDAAEAAVVALEECPLFNAGRGSVLNRDGEVELDAALMAGEDRRAGAVACVAGVRNPIRLARAVLEDGRHVLLAGDGAHALARERGLELVAPGFHITDRELERWRRRAGGSSFGTVGAVALDGNGSLAAATSTGGIRGKRPGRIGDSPIVGAGTFADRTCAISASGDGEHLIRTVAAHQIAALVTHGGRTIADAAELAVESVAELGGQAGLIALDAAGHWAMPHNTAVFNRGVLAGDGPPRTGVGEELAET